MSSKKALLLQLNKIKISFLRLMKSFSMSMKGLKILTLRVPRRTSAAGQESKVLRKT